MSDSSSGSSDVSLSASERRIRRLVAEFERSLRESFPKENEPKTLAEIEQLTDKIGESIKETIQRDAVEQQGSGFVGSRISCGCCGRAMGARHRGTQARQIVTLHGSVAFVRSYYHCVGCGKGFFPLDRQLEIGSGQLSVAVVSLLSRFACYLSFREAAREIEIVCGVRLSSSTITRYAQAVGHQLQQAHAERREQVRRALEAGDPIRRALEAGDPSEQDKLCPLGVRPTRQQITMDGVLIHVGGQWREAKLGCLYRPDRKSGAQDAAYFATLSNSTRFGSDLHAFAVASGSLKCRERAVVADGAEWILSRSCVTYGRKVGSILPPMCKFWTFTMRRNICGM